MSENRKPMLYLTWDATGMYIWLGTRPQRHNGVYRQVNGSGKEIERSVRMRLPVTWFGGLVEEGGCREIDPEIALGETMAL